ncbi:MAG: 23S rRNA (uracil(1939)-C(5))-methyltransferase RlmD [Coriobacteriaceae bacterium]|nr:23S rRNA (uracil(1939)-C(5))-methyltransferase RlmD [Coriobacteriaceae bacterium]
MQLTIDTMTYGPDGLARTADGKAVFVSGGLVGDTVEARIVEDGASFSRAVVEEVLEASPHREQPPCPFSGVCGGCPWGGLNRDAQLKAKEENLRSTLMRIGKFSAGETDALMRPIRFTKDAWGYRNKIELAPVLENGRFRLGMHGRDASQVIKVNACPLFEPKHAKAVKAVTGALGYLGNSRDLQLERVGIRASRRTGALEIALWTPTGGFPRAQVARVLNDAVKATSVVRVMSKGEKRARRVSSVEMLSGEGSWTEKIGSETMRLSAPSFFQVNTKAAEILVDLVMEALDPQRDELGMDLYCGAGTFTLPLARRCDFVSAVESYGPAVRDLRRNLNSANITNVDVIGGDAVREFPDNDADVLIVDPPRAGLAPDAIDLIASTSARDVAYVSCDPATLARDLRRFVEEGTFKPVSATPVDLFPQTFHCETVTHLTRVKT